MKALAKLALTLCLMLSSLPGFAQSQTISTAPDFSRAELDQMLAPIALYPDTVLSHVLIASTYPLEVVQADRWARANSGLDPQTAINAVDDQDWDPSVKALVAFPEILRTMSDDLDWTQRVGDAFLADESEVMGVIQDLRQKAYASGNLNKLEHVRVQREEKVIVIEPAVERVVYVPYYDTRVVYGGWWWPDYPPVYWHHPRHNVVVGTGFYWGPRVYVAPSFYFSSVHWHRRRVVVVDHHHHRHHDHPRFYTSRGIAHHNTARHWSHNPHHRRGVVYRNDNVKRHYGSNRESYRSLQEQRNPTRNFSAGGQQANGRNLRDQDRNHPRPNLRDDNRKDIRSSGEPRSTHADRVRERLSNDNDGRTRQLQGAKTGQGPREQDAQRASRPDNKAPQRVERANSERSQPQATARDNPKRDLQRPQEARPATSQRTGDTRREERVRTAVQPQQNNFQRAEPKRAENRPQNVQRPQEVQRTQNVQRPQTQQARPEPSRRPENLERTNSRPTEAQRRMEQPRPQMHRDTGGGNARSPRESGAREQRARPER